MTLSIVPQCVGRGNVISLNRPSFLLRPDIPPTLPYLSDLGVEDLWGDDKVAIMLAAMRV